jgi:3-deoxy-manno-octulosonate cytidylyltransferase (CMP-KDO synthetase)
MNPARRTRHGPPGFFGAPDFRGEIQMALVVIPARYGSTRFPGKPLAPIGGLPMILHVYRGASRIGGVDRVVVATDDERIRKVVEDDGGTALMTRKSHTTGTSRVAEVAASIEGEIVLNIQGDEPLLPKRGIEKLIRAMRDDPGILMGTLATPSTDPKEHKSPDVVKVVCSASGDALYFSRSPIPHSGGRFLKHIGVYAYRREFLLRYASLGRGPLEKTERLEQLRALENGAKIRVVICRTDTIGVDRPSDIKRVEKRLKRR